MSTGSHASREARAGRYLLVYLALRPEERSTKRVWEIAVANGDDLHENTIERYCTDFGWVDLAHEYDQSRTDDLTRNSLDRAMLNDAEHAHLGKLLEDTAAAGARKLGAEPELSGTEIARLADVGSKLRRLAAGQATENQQILVSVWQTVLDTTVPLYREAMEQAFVVLFAEIDEAEHPGLRDRAMQAGATVFGPGIDDMIESHFRARGAELPAP